MEEWLNRIATALRTGDYQAALTVYDERATPHASAPNAADKRTAIRLVCELLPTAAERLSFAQAAITHDTSGSRSLAAMVARYAYAASPAEVAALLYRLADDGNWEVREWAGSAAGFTLGDNFEQFYPTIQTWSKDPNANVRRAVCIAVMDAADRKKPERAEPLLALLDPLIADRDEYVRKNLGPFAIGACLISYYPQPTIARLLHWLATDDSEATRWNLAMVFSAGQAKKQIDLGFRILTALTADPRRFVWRATVLPLRNLAKADRARVTALLESWRDDPARQQVAEEALRYIEKDAAEREE
jgi:3-methyladenine DNA glycosylase AlkD